MNKSGLNGGCHLKKEIKNYWEEGAWNYDCHVNME